VLIEPSPATNEPRPGKLLLSPPVLGSLAAVGLLVVVGSGNVSISIVAMCALAALGVVLWVLFANHKGDPEKAFHRVLEGRAVLFSGLTVLAVLIGGIVELVPVVVLHGKTADPKKYPPYRALELEGRDVYVREGCYTCHSQMIRPFLHEQLRYGDPSLADESAWDHPFQWGSKRTGPDLAREGGKYPNLWHHQHLTDPRAISPGSIMPAYAFLEHTSVAYDDSPHKLAAMKTLGVPYTDAQVRAAAADARAQAADVKADLEKAGAHPAADTEMLALIAYLQRLGKPPVAKDDRTPVAQHDTQEGNHHVP
jgi:cytochrome c oxidase cbb3-type subunit I/II